MKKYLVLLALIALLLTGCAKEPGTAPLGSPAPLPAQSAPPQMDIEIVDAPGAETDPSDIPEAEAPPLHDVAVPAPVGDVVQINERLFIAQTNDIYINAEDYLGKTIQYEGIFQTGFWPEKDQTFYYVIRYGPGCCGYDGEAGFEVTWDGEWPEENDWCEAVGVLEVYEMDGGQYLRLALSSLTVLQERGAEFVSS